MAVVPKRFRENDHLSWEPRRRFQELTRVERERGDGGLDGDVV